jgi:hypothetical protein
VITKSADKTPKIEVEVTRIQEVSDIIKRFTFTPVDGAPTSWWRCRTVMFFAATRIHW